MIAHVGCALPSGDSDVEVCYVHLEAWQCFRRNLRNKLYIRRQYLSRFRLSVNQGYLFDSEEISLPVPYPSISGSLLNRKSEFGATGQIVLSLFCVSPL